MAVSPEVAGATLATLADRLTDTRKLRKDYAWAIRRKAEANAAGRPTPQAQRAAQGLRVKGGTVLGFPNTRVGGVRMGAISFGAEFGSNVYPQFAPRRESGYFLGPAAESVDDRPGTDWLELAFRGLRGIR